MSDARKLLRKIAAEMYDQVAENGDEFDLDFVRSLVVSDEAALGLGKQLLEVAAEAAVDYVDQSRRSRPEQTEMFGDMDRVLAIGDGRRKRKGSCKAEDYAAHMQIVAANVASVTAAAAREQDEYARLLPYLARGMNGDEAAAAWRADNPEGI